MKVCTRTTSHIVELWSLEAPAPPAVQLGTIHWAAAFTAYLTPMVALASTSFFWQFQSMSCCSCWPRVSACAWRHAIIYDLCVCVCGDGVVCGWGWEYNKLFNLRLRNLSPCVTKNGNREIYYEADQWILADNNRRQINWSAPRCRFWEYICYELVSLSLQSNQLMVSDSACGPSA